MNNNLELELKRIEYSDSNDKISFEHHSYNRFSGLEDCEVYNKHLDRIYNDYFAHLRINTDNLLINNRADLLKYLQDKTTLFNSIKLSFETKNLLTFWDNYIKSCEKYFTNNIQNNVGAKNEYYTAQFFKRMSETQLHYIEKAIDELNQIYNIYNPNSEPQKISQEQIDKEIWDNTLSEYGDILNTFDLAKIFNKDEATIRRWARQGIVTPIDKQKRPMQFIKDEIKKYYLKLIQQ